MIKYSLLFTLLQLFAFAANAGSMMDARVRTIQQPEIMVGAQDDASVVSPTKNVTEPQT